MIIAGNGTSRKKINLNLYNETKIGCNAIYRDYYVDYLVCCDKSMVKEAHANDITPVYTRERWLADFNYQDVMSVPKLPYKGDKRLDDPFHWGSGPYAVLMGASLSENCKLIGFDLYGTNNHLNNIYADTNGYKSLYDEAVDWTYWVYQIAKVFEHFPNVQFKIYNEQDWECPNSWKKSNVKVDKLENL